MVDVAAESLRCLIDLDVAGMRRIHASAQPHLPLGSDADVLAGLHGARTAVDGVPLKLRLYSHHWLTDRGMPSQLPDHLKPKPEQIVPRIVSGVGIMVSASSEELEPAAMLVRNAMENAVKEADADGRLLDSDFVKARMMEARRKELRSLILPDKSRMSGG